MDFTTKFSGIYKAILLALFKFISIIMIIVGLLIALCIVADNVFHLGWGYPWWSFIFCILYVGISIMVYRAIPGVIGYLESQRSRPASHNRNGDEDLS
jgi:membrane protein implicated in regulation of membrane protease activity